MVLPVVLDHERPDTDAQLVVRLGRLARLDAALIPAVDAIVDLEPLAAEMDGTRIGIISTDSLRLQW